MAPRPAIDRRLRQMASGLTPAWLESQRWYRAKSHRLQAVELFDAAPIHDGHGWLLVVAATDDTGRQTRYLVPAIKTLESFAEPDDGDGVWAYLAWLLLEGGEVKGRHGTWRFSPTPAAAELRPAGATSPGGLAERRLGVEQSNTSVAIGEALILKVYRLLEAGGNPEVDVSEFLTAVGFQDAPALAGSANYLLDGQPHSSAMLQQLVRSSGDGWNWVLALLGSRDGQEAAIAGIHEIGSLTARMHRALGSRPETPGFPSRTATPEERAAWRAAAEGQLEGALAAVDGPLSVRLAAIAPSLAMRLAAIETAGEARVSRIHGDYHLGQLLRTDDGFTVLDFEGEPARSLAERRLPASPLRDVAGMLRSLDYAAYTAGRNGLPAARVQEWLADARAALLAGYGGMRSADAPLLAALELEKACYEVAYEANNRPDWAWLPIEALERLAV